MIRNGRFNNNFLASCDAVALYPSIIIEEALEILEQMIWNGLAYIKKVLMKLQEINCCAQENHLLYKLLIAAEQNSSAVETFSFK